MVQRALRSSGFEPSPVHLALLDKGQRSVKGLASGREGVVTIDLVLTVRKPLDPGKFSTVEIEEVPARDLLGPAVEGLSPESARNPSYVYMAAVKEAMRRRLPVDHLHLSDVLVALSAAGYSIDPKSGLLDRPVTSADL